MAKIITSVFFFVGVLVLHVSAQRQIPTQLTFPLTSQSVNGSTANGHCAGATRLSDRYQCDDPTSSVVYDGHFPTLTGLDGNMWANQLLTINASSAVLVFTRTPNFQLRRVEIVVFNCPQWGISVRSVRVTNSQLAAVNPTLSSCDSLVRVCIPNLNITSSQLSVLILEFTTHEPTDWIHIAEVGFYSNNYSNSAPCPPEIIIPEPTTATISTTEITGVAAGVAAGIFFLMVAAVIIIIVVAVICLKSKKGKVWRLNAHDVLNKTDNIYNDKVKMDDIKGPKYDKGNMYDVLSHNRSGCIQSPANQEEAYSQPVGNKPLAQYGDESREAYSQLEHSGRSGAGKVPSASKEDNPVPEMYIVVNKSKPPLQSTQPSAQEYAVVNKDTNRRKPPSQPTQPPGQDYSVLN